MKHTIAKSGPVSLAKKLVINGVEVWVSFRLPAELRKEIRQISSTSGFSISDLGRESLRRLVRDYHQTGKLSLEFEKPSHKT